MYNKNNLQAVNFCSKPNSGRQELAGVLFTKDKTVATDSFSLLEIKNTITDKALEDYPIIPDVKPMDGQLANAGVIVPQEVIKDIKLPKNSNLPILNNCIFTGKNNPDFIDITTTDLNTAKTLKARAISGTFPDYKNLIPTLEDINANGKTVIISIEILKKMATALDKMDGIELKAVTMSIMGEHKPVIFKAKAKDASGYDQDITGLIMPMKK